MVKAIYAFSGDPITYGHINIIKRAAKAFDEVIVGIGANPSKKYTFSLEERAEMAKKTLEKLSNVKVNSFDGLLVDYAYENGISTIVKGVRNSADFDYENVLHQVGESQKLGIETFILFADPKLAHVSSSAVKSIQKEHGLIHEYVPLYVKQKLEEKISGQYILGITGEMGCGKSYVSKKFVELGKEKGLQVHNIDLDKIGHAILSDLKEPVYQEIREKIVNEFGDSVGTSEKINRKALGEIVFNDNYKLDRLNEIMHTPIITRLRREIYDKQGVIIIDAALIAEAGLAYLCNNNVVLVSADKESQKRRLYGRALNEDQIQRRLSSQYDFNNKYKTLEDKIKQDNQGKLWVIENSDSSDASQINLVFEDIVKYLGVK